ncbi:carbohydrate-binding protein [Gallibacter intestinalis]|uniref:C1q domain-containing protein n=1 Tax=Gallibacter intestinalis TaxID=2779356 RepID=A0ABR9QXU6_9FIRM|nr:hypothetical protein [Gallibacter intestinalis]MBE5035708.1 hypothetical protein [Gallibacter intestinalis]
MDENTIDSMLGFTAGKIGDIDGTLANVGTYVNRDVGELHVSASDPSSIEMTIPEDGTYVVSASCGWHLTNTNLSTFLSLFHNGGNPQATAQGTMQSASGTNVTTVIDAKKGDTVTLQISWSGGSGSVTAERVRFRAVRVGGGQ